MCLLVFYLMKRRQPRSTRTKTRFPSTTLFRSVAGQIKANRRSLPRLAVDANLAAGLPHETVDHGKTQTRAPADRLGREERLEDPVGDVLRYACPRVGDAYRDILSWRQVALDRKSTRLNSRH